MIEAMADGGAQGSEVGASASLLSVGTRFETTCPDEHQLGPSNVASPKVLADHVELETGAAGRKGNTVGTQKCQLCMSQAPPPPPPPSS